MAWHAASPDYASLHPGYDCANGGEVKEQIYVMAGLGPGMTESKATIDRGVKRHTHGRSALTFDS